MSTVSDVADALFQLGNTLASVYTKDAESGEVIIMSPKEIAYELTKPLSSLSKLAGIPLDNARKLVSAVSDRMVRRVLGKYVGEYQIMKANCIPL